MLGNYKPRSSGTRGKASRPMPKNMLGISVECSQDSTSHLIGAFREKENKGGKRIEKRSRGEMKGREPRRTADTGDWP